MRSVEVQIAIDGVLGTRLDLFAHVTSSRFVRDSVMRTHIESIALDEVDRLEAIYSIFNPLTEMQRWRAGDVAAIVGAVAGAQWRCVQPGGWCGV
jgi:hypothetical protein